MITELDKEEILRYLGYKDSMMTKRMEDLLERCMQETLKIIQPKYRMLRFPIKTVEDGVHVEGTTLILKGNDIGEHLKHCNEIILVGATVGMMLDRSIRKYMFSEPDAGVVMDSCGIQAVEQVLDCIEQEIEESVENEGYHLTWRFSPGYGDFPLETQREMVQILDLSRKAGITLTESCLMVPSKSVTALWGIADTKRDSRENKCDFCNHRGQCGFRKRGKTC